MNDIAIEVSTLKKSFGGHPALNGLGLRVPAGSIFGFLGRNGAGKTTTIKILMGMPRSDSGAARMLGLDVCDPAQNIASLCLGAIFFLAAVRAVQTRQYGKR